MKAQEIYQLVEEVKIGPKHIEEAWQDYKRLSEKLYMDKTKLSQAVRESLENSNYKKIGKKYCRENIYFDGAHVFTDRGYDDLSTSSMFGFANSRKEAIDFLKIHYKKNSSPSSIAAINIALGAVGEGIAAAVALVSDVIPPDEAVRQFFGWSYNEQIIAYSSMCVALPALSGIVSYIRGKIQKKEAEEKLKQYKPKYGYEALEELIKTL